VAEIRGPKILQITAGVHEAPGAVDNHCSCASSASVTCFRRAALARIAIVYSVAEVGMPGEPDLRTALPWLDGHPKLGLRAQECDVKAAASSAQAQTIEPPRVPPLGAVTGAV